MSKRKKIIICLYSILLITAAFSSGETRTTFVGTETNLGAASDYCSGQSWQTLSGFRLDFDHTTDSKIACLLSGTSTGEAVGAPAFSTTSPACIGSGGNVLIADASGEYLQFDVSNVFFNSKYGEIYFKIKNDGNNTTDIQILNIIGIANQDRLQISIVSNGYIQIYWEDNNAGTQSFNVVDTDGYYGDWIQVYLKWDVTRCTDGTCDGAGEDEFCYGYRVDADNDGDWDSAFNMFCESSTYDFSEWAAEPGDDNLSLGFINGTFNFNISIDDLEISSAKPTW